MSEIPTPTETAAPESKKGKPFGKPFKKGRDARRFNVAKLKKKVGEAMPVPEFARDVLNDPRVQAQIRRKARAGSLHPSVFNELIKRSEGKAPDKPPARPDEQTRAQRLREEVRRMERLTSEERLTLAALIRKSLGRGDWQSGVPYCKHCGKRSSDPVSAPVAVEPEPGAKVGGPRIGRAAVALREARASQPPAETAVEVTEPVVDVALVPEVLSGDVVPDAPVGRGFGNVKLLKMILEKRGQPVPPMIDPTRMLPARAEHPWQDVNHRAGCGACRRRWRES
jgi:hypothetical protein